MNKIIANPGATAYHFLIHEYKLTHNSTFNENDLESFVDCFFKHTEALGYSFIDKEGNSFSREQMTDAIIDNFVDYTTNDIDQIVCYFNSDNIEEMRNEYEKCNFQYKALIYRLEETLAKENYNNRSIYTLLEKGYKKSLKYIEKDDEKHLA